MTAVQLLWLLLAGLWVGCELALTHKSRQAMGDFRHDKGSAGWLWGTCAAAVVAALLFKHWHYLPLALPYLPRQAVALVLFAAGVGLRMAAIAYLGRLFTSHITINHSHHLVKKGPYRWLRHPSYLGLLLAFAAAGLAMGDGLALLALTLPVAVAVRHRIQLEEAVLAGHFPDEYPLYSKTTKKLLPWIY